MSAACIVALGSNLGNRAAQITSAIDRIRHLPLTKLTSTSLMYESEAWPPRRDSPRPPFLNAACRIDTSLDCHQLLSHLQTIEAHFGRVRSLDSQWASRAIDLDVIRYADRVMSTERITVPHSRAHERDFVLRPWADIEPQYRHPLLGQSVQQLLDYLPCPPLRPVLHVGDSMWTIGLRTYVMGIVNITPDSFSDGGEHFSTESAVHQACNLVAQGADIVDLGGQSTRPGADVVPVDAELDRVLPVIERLRADAPSMLISIDTFRAQVAEAAIAAGANMINDISAGRMDPDMLPAVARLHVPYVFMHMRGDPKSMSSLSQYHNVASEVNEELERRAQAAIDAGVMRYNLIADPGIGFAKSADQNLQLIRAGPASRLPTLIGTSRKRFIGDLTGEAVASDRDFGTAATVAASIASGFDIVRVHNVEAMVDVSRVADSIWRRSPPPPLIDQEMELFARAECTVSEAVPRC